MLLHASTINHGTVHAHVACGYGIYHVWHMQLMAAPIQPAHPKQYIISQVQDAFKALSHHEKMNGQSIVQGYVHGCASLFAW